MNQVQRACTECPRVFLTNRSDKTTCSANCRVKRSRRKASEQKFREFADASAEGALALEEARKVARADATVIARQVMAKQLEGPVREALEPIVLQHIAGMVGMVPQLVQAMEDGLSGTPLYWDDVEQANGDTRRVKVTYRTDAPVLLVDGTHVRQVDPDLQHKYATLLARYTIGQPGLAPQPEAASAGGLTVVFPGMPAPGFVDGTASDSDDDRPVLEAGESICDTCDEAKPDSEFEAGSTRCSACFAAQQERAQEIADSLAKK